MDTSVQIIGFVIAVVSCIICVRVASSKRRSKVGYGILGFVLPLIGIIVVLVLPPKDA